MWNFHLQSKVIKAQSSRHLPQATSVNCHLHYLPTPSSPYLTSSTGHSVSASCISPSISRHDQAPCPRDNLPLCSRPPYQSSDETLGTHHASMTRLESAAGADSSTNACQLCRSVRVTNMSGRFKDFQVNLPDQNNRVVSLSA